MWLAITAVSMLAVGAVAVYTVGVVTDVLRFLQPVLVPIAFAGILAYLMEPIVKKVTHRGTPRFRAMMWLWVGHHGIMLLLLSKPLTSAHGVAGGSALGGLPSLSSSGGLGWNRLWLGDRGVGGGGKLTQQCCAPVLC